MVLLGTVCGPHIIHLMQGPLRALSLVQAVVVNPGVEVEAGPLVAAEGFGVNAATDPYCSQLILRLR
jgi:hypothetical protein